MVSKKKKKREMGSGGASWEGHGASKGVSEPVKRVLEPIGRALETAARVLELTMRALEPAGRPGAGRTS